MNLLILHRLGPAHAHYLCWDPDGQRFGRGDPMWCWWDGATPRQAHQATTRDSATVIMRPWRCGSEYRQKTRWGQPPWAITPQRRVLLVPRRRGRCEELVAVWSGSRGERD